MKSVSIRISEEEKEGTQDMMKWLTLLVVLVVVLWGATAGAEDCIDIRLDAKITPGEPRDLLSLYFHAENCGEKVGVATVKVTAMVDVRVVESPKFRVRMPAGVIISRSLDLPLPAGTPPGTYTLCITAELGNAHDSTCATVTIDDEGRVLGFHPHESTTGGVSTLSWGEVKAGYK
jgi:hypothetical protein